MAIAGLGVIGIAAGAAWAWWLHDDDLSARRGSLLAAGARIGPRSFGDRPACRAPLTPDEPLRLWIGGDSLTGTLGPTLGELTAESGVVRPTYDYRTSSGLASPSFFDWPTHAAWELARLDPEAVVFVIGANDSAFADPATLGPFDDPPWRGAYRSLVEEMLTVLSEGGQLVYWIGSPTLRDGDKDDGVRALNAVAREVIESNGHVYVDAYSLFSDADGGFTPTVRDRAGEVIRVRTSDGIHLTPAGGELLAEFVFAYLDEHCDISRQAVPGRRQPVDESPGSGEVPGPPPSPVTSPTTTVTEPPITTTTAPPTSTTEVTLPQLLDP